MGEHGWAWVDIGCCWWLWSGYGYKFERKCWVLICWHCGECHSTHTIDGFQPVSATHWLTCAINILRRWHEKETWHLDVKFRWQDYLDYECIYGPTVQAGFPGPYLPLWEVIWRLWVSFSTLQQLSHTSIACNCSDLEEGLFYTWRDRGSWERNNYCLGFLVVMVGGRLETMTGRIRITI